MGNKAHGSNDNTYSSDADESARELVSGRIGPTGKRTYHCHVEHVPVGGGTAAIDYLERAGDFESLDDDLEWIVGNPDEVREAAWQVDLRAQKRNGRTAEKVLSKITFELPATLSSEQRGEAAERVVARLKRDGYEVCAAVHAINVQPHVHVALASRPTVNIELGMWDVDRNPDRIFLRGGKKALRNLRHQIAEDINQVLGHSLFHGGKHCDVGIDRNAKRRIPQRQWRQHGVRDNDTEFVEECRQRYERERAEAKRRANQKRAAKHEKHREIAINTPIYRLLESRLKATSGHNKRLRQKLKDEKRKSAEIVEIVKNIPVPAELPEDQQPATMKQIRYLEDMAKRKNLIVNDDVVLSRGMVGATLRKLEKLPNRGLRTRDRAR